jgi:hypothetical protein
VIKETLLLLIGSPRKKGTSASFAASLAASAEKLGMETRLEYAIDYCDGKKSIEVLAGSISDASIVGIVSPMYVDTLPYPVIFCLEGLYFAHREALAGKRLFALVQYGFPDIRLCKPSLAVCQCFARAAGMAWMGGMGYGGGPLINGAPLHTLGSKGARISGALEEALHAVLEDGEIPAKTQVKLAEKIPAALFWPLSMLMNLRARSEARKLGTDLRARPYL